MLQFASGLPRTGYISSETLRVLGKKQPLPSRLSELAANPPMLVSGSADRPVTSTVHYFRELNSTRGQEDGVVTWEEVTRQGEPATRATLKLDHPSIEVTVTFFRSTDVASAPNHYRQEINLVSGIDLQSIEHINPPSVPGITTHPLPFNSGEQNYYQIRSLDGSTPVTALLRGALQQSELRLSLGLKDGREVWLNFGRCITGNRMLETVLATWERVRRCDCVAPGIADRAQTGRVLSR